MAGFEVVVRPVVFPNIRPAPARSLPPVDDPTKGFATIKGNGGKEVGLTHSWSASSSKQKSIETERRVDEARIYQEEDDGTVNKKNFVDVEAANRIKTKTARAAQDPTELGTSGTIGGRSSNVLYEDAVTFYRRLDVDRKNIEILRQNIIKKNDAAAAAAARAGE